MSFALRCIPNNIKARLNHLRLNLAFIIFIDVTLPGKDRMAENLHYL